MLKPSIFPVLPRFLAVALIASCHSAPPVTPMDVTPVSPPMARTVPHENLNSVVWVQTSAEYRAGALQAFTAAQHALDIELGRPQDTAAVEQTGNYASLPPAVIVDIDDTVLDNSPFEARLIESGASYSSAGWNEWVGEARAAAVPGAVEFARYAAARGVTVFYISNRDFSTEESTRRNLLSEGFPVDTSTDVVLLRGERPEWKSDDKTPRRQEVAAHYRVLLLVGDNLGDFFTDDHSTVAQRTGIVDRYSDRWGTSWIVIPNPMYGSWEAAAINYQRSAPADEQLRLKRSVLRTAPNR
ncbi:MAG: HAD family acid phosphatase [Acidobacteriota bacterium]